ncbi:MAG: DUF2848 family protein [Acidimicrobiia bacterium]
MTRIAVIQVSAQDGNDLGESKRVVTEALDRAGPSDLYLLPEIWSPGYFSFDSYADAAEMFQETSEFLSEQGKARGAYLHGGSIVERRGDRLHNTSLLFSPQGDLVASYRKIHLFGYQSREQQILTPGDEVVVADTELGRIGMAVCYDLRFPEQFRRMTDMGARLFLIASAWPHPRVEAWTTLLRARAIESQAYLAAANGAPGAGGASLCGRSAIIDPWGVTLASAGVDTAEVVADIDLSGVDEARTRFPELTDRRILGEEPGVLSLARDDAPPLRFETRRVVLAGYTARDEEAVRAYVAGLEEKGIAAPKEIPTYFHVGRELVTTGHLIDVTGARTCGEVEFVLLVDHDGEIWVAAGSDHTDRDLEERSIPAAKQACPKPISLHVWPYSAVRDHWDQLVLRSFTPADSPAAYQEAAVAVLRHPDDLLERVGDRIGADLAGTVIFGGSFASLTGSFEYEDSFRAELHDPVTGKTLVARYQVNDVLEGDGNG